ncbi:hypothetical protein [Massilia yuzhufengensis]|uniref:Uncharacterized protein n=1 Tax=Massilia yuzhufengensis TaxID=1164594 RepID=A0A1I1PUJ5_9BURK|nr:hypothetical protein [Massilia yuzhufengensis]SFD10653.1 hypothetical protein SAMN05216204_11656 [Massilia yuzhufengensis]
MPLIDTLATLLGRASRALGLETVDSFPPGHPYARTRWNKAYFDIASDLKPDAIEHAVCEAIANTPLVFGEILNPTPRMQRTLLGVIEQRLRRTNGAPVDLAQLLVASYRSPHTMEAVPGLRQAIRDTSSYEPHVQANAILAYLADAPAAFGVIEARA